MQEDVKTYLDKAAEWQPLMLRLRDMLLEQGLQESFKWRTPCYCHENTNLFLVAHGSNSCMLSLLKGALLSDPHKLLETPGQYSRAVRMMSFQSAQQLDQLEPIVRSYIAEAIELEKAGVKIDFEKDRDLPYPDELTNYMDADPEFAEAFLALTPGRQRGYIMHFTQAKQSKTRTARIEKFRERIFDGKGMMDCVCGLSKRMPGCDGSHKQLKQA